MRDETQCCFHNLISTQIFWRALAQSVDRCDDTLQASLSGTDHPSNSTRTCYATEEAFLTSEHLSADAVIYHWRERLQVSFLSRQKFCRDKGMLVATKVCLSRQKYACRDKTFLVAKVCLSRQQFCRKKIMFVATNVCRSKHVFVATKVLLRQKFYLWQLPPMRFFGTNKTGSNNVETLT